jgi:large subunit ribosomal protein L31
MPKANIHPQWYPEAKVICNGEVVAVVGSTKPELHVDTWSGNHPFFTGTQKIIDTEGRVERFLRKYKMDAPPAPAVSDTAEPAEPPAKTAPAPTAKGKKKK